MMLDPQTGETVFLPDLVPIFPLPETVLFPSMTLPLHVFEPRYRSLAADALLDARLIAIALLRPGFEPLYESSRAPIHSLVGVGRIVAARQVDDGRYYLMLRGVARAQIVEELGGRPYRRGKLEVIAPLAAPEETACAALRPLLAESAARALADDADLEQWQELFASDAPFEVLIDVLCAALPLIGEVRQQLLAEPDPLSRARRVIDHLATAAALRARRGDIGPTIN